MTLSLLADIGGTHARFALADSLSAPRSIEVLKVADFAQPLSAIRTYLKSVGNPRLGKAAFALACPVVGDHARLTNAGWHFDRVELQKALGVPQLLLLNDFEALAWSLPGLSSRDGYQFGGRQGVRRAPLALIGPGTGLGVSGLLPTAGDGWVALAGEGGHASLAPSDSRESEILEFLWQTHEHVSGERLLCGAGMPLLLQAVAQIDQIRGHRAPDDYGDAAAITAAAQSGDPLALATVECFSALLGAAAGNLALTLGARGGVYIGGGIVPRLGRLFKGSTFRQRFEAKGRFRAYLKAIPVYVITADAPALSGALWALKLPAAVAQSHHFSPPNVDHPVQRASGQAVN
jgi:glucokinase